MLILAIGGLVLITALLLTLVTARYRSPFHPLLMPALNLLVMAACAPFAQQMVAESTLPEDSRLMAIGLSAVYLLGLALPLLVPVNPLLPMVELCARPLEVTRRPEFRKIYVLFAALLFAGFAAGYGLLLRDSSAGWGWLTDPRGSYLQGRAGVGHWYVSAQACLLLSLLVLLYFTRVRSVWLIGGLGLGTGVLFVFFGSKAGILGTLIAAALYYNFYVRRITLVMLTVGGVILLPAALLSPLLQGNFDSLRDTLSYYDYFDNSVRFLTKVDRIGVMSGGAALSELWTYVPRGLYPDKPFIYGQLYINDYFWSGAAENGHTPALLPWAIYHLDFGPAGVFAAALALGCASKAVYTWFLRTRSFVAFVCYLQLCFVPVIKHVPWAYFVLMLLALTVTLRAFVCIMSGTRGRMG